MPCLRVCVRCVYVCVVQFMAMGGLPAPRRSEPWLPWRPDSATLQPCHLDDTVLMANSLNISPHINTYNKINCRVITLNVEEKYNDKMNKKIFRLS